MGNECFVDTPNLARELFAPIVEIDDVPYFQLKGFGDLLGDDDLAMDQFLWEMGIAIIEEMDVVGRAFAHRPHLVFGEDTLMAQ